MDSTIDMAPCDHQKEAILDMWRGRFVRMKEIISIPDMFNCNGIEQVEYRIECNTETKNGMNTTTNASNKAVC